MKKIAIFLLSSAILFLDCARVSEDIRIQPVEQAQEILENSFSVSVADLEKMIQQRLFSTETKSSTLSVSYEVIPYGLNEAETLMYIVNYSSGKWEIISADKRTPVVLACGDGSFCLGNEDHGSTLYLKMLAENILELRQKEMILDDDNVFIWAEATKEPLCFQDVATKAVVNYTYVLGSNSEVDVEEHVEPLLYTQWGQSGYDDMYNYYCPYKTDTTGVRASAGCTVVAGAQVLHYLYKTLGANIYMPNTASCSGVIGNYTQQFSNSCNMYYIRDILLKPAERNVMPHRKEYTRIFLAWIGHKIGVEYKNDGSGASLGSLAEVFDLYGIDFCHQESYDYNIVAENILDGKPVIVCGFREVTKSDSPETKGHAWVIDGYKRTLTDRDIYCYRSSVELTEEEAAALTMNDCNYVFNSRTTKREFNMNWGWSGDHDGWFLFSADNWNVKGTPYNSNLEMMYNFTKK